MSTNNPTDEVARMTMADLADRVRPLLSGNPLSPGWYAVTDGYASAAATTENLRALWGFTVGVGYAIADEADVDGEEAADLAFRAGRDEPAAAGYNIAGQEMV